MSSKTTRGNAPDYAEIIKDDIMLSKLAVVSFSEAIDIARGDADIVSSDASTYVRDNQITYYLLLNSWLLQVKEVSERGCFELLEAVLKVGLYIVIDQCSAVANYLVAKFGNVDMFVAEDIPQYLVNLISSCKDDRQVLQLLRYPKRFSPRAADLLTKKSVDAFLSINKRCQQINRNGWIASASFRQNHKSSTPSWYWVERIRSRISSILDGYDCNVDNGLFSTGVAADAARPLASKLHSYASWVPYIYDYKFPIGTGCSVVKRVPSDYAAIVLAVPKSYKTSRIIAEEHAYRQFHMQAIRREIEKCIVRNGYKDYLDLHSQDRNQRYAQIGSIHGVYATIDLSSASDSVARTLAYDVLPSNVVRDIDEFLPRYFSIGKKTHVMHMFCTSGSAVTFPVESLIFLAMALEVRDTATALTGECYLPPVVFGDDIVIDSALYDTAVDVLNTLGFVVNTDKSFATWSAYRESCGSEFVSGYDLRSHYWPRRTFAWKSSTIVEDIFSICSLQHRLYDVYMVRKFLATFVRTIVPEMTSHQPGSECEDLWETIPVYQKTHAPGLRDCTDVGAERERHLSSRTRRRADLDSRSHLSGYSSRQVVEMWRYATFLREGPSYDDELLRLLGVSSKPSPIVYDVDTGVQFFTYVTE